MEVCIYADEGGGLLNNWGSIRADSREEENLLLIYFFFSLFSFTKYLQREIDKIFRSINRDAFFKFLNYMHVIIRGYSKVRVDFLFSFWKLFTRNG